LEQVQTLLCLLLPLPRVEIMPAKKKGPSMRENQQRKLTMQKIAKGGPQLSGVKKPAPATPSAGRRINPKAAKPKPAAPAKPSGPARPSIGNVRGPGGRGRPASAQATDTRRFQAMNQSASARAGQAAEPKPRTPAPGTGNVLKAAQQFSKDKAAKDREIRRQAATNRTALNRQMVGKAALLLGGPKALAVKAVAETVAPRPTAKGTLSGGGAQGPAMPKRLEQQGLAAQERKARQALTARKKAAGSKEATPNTAASFDDAFRDARRAKVKTFTWRGKKYTTEMK
jgi:hypothetical protein